MSDIKQQAFIRGLNMLTASGAIYAVYHNNLLHCSSGASFAMETPDGLVGTLEVVVQKKKRTKGSDRVSWAYTGYLDGIKVLGIGEVWSYQGCDKKEAQGLQRAVTGNAGKLWGPGNFISTVDAKHKFEILRVV